MGALAAKERIIIAVAFVASVLAGILSATHAAPLIIFVAAAIGLASLANIIGAATEQLGQRLGPGATGVLQSALGNLPELFICIFALREGLITVVQTALVGSILANSLLALGLAFFFGGIKNGRQHFESGPARMIATMTLLAVTALTVPTAARLLHTPVAQHEGEMSIGCAVLLLVVFLASIPMSIKGGPTALPSKHGDVIGLPEGHSAETAATPAPAAHAEQHWPLWLAIVLLALAGGGAAVVSDWFVNALDPAIKMIGMSEAFAGLVVVAIAGNAVENIVGIQMAADNKPDYAVSIILNSSLQVAMALVPILVLLSFVVSSHHLTLVMPPLLIVSLVMTAIVTTVITVDGESNWLEGLILIGLYAIIAMAFWWG